MKNFTDLNLSFENMDIYVRRKSIFNSIKWGLKRFKGDLLDVGCGKMPYKDFILSNSEINKYVGLDIENALEYDKNIKADYLWDGKTMPFDNNSYQTILCTEVFEHCFEIDSILSEINRVLDSNGVLFFTIPFVWNLHEVPHDNYRYTPFSLEKHLKKNGFTEFIILTSGGWNSFLAQSLGTWIKRSGLSKIKMKCLSYLILPIMKILLNKDNKNRITFTEGQMITDLFGIAVKKN